MIGLWCVLGTAWAFDAHGILLVPGQGQPGDPLYAWAPWDSAARSWNVAVNWEYANTLLVRQIVEGEVVTEEVPVLGLLGANITGSYALTDRVGLGLTAPLWLGQSNTSDEAVGSGLGSWRVWAPIAVRYPDSQGFGLSVVPFVDLPTGSSAMYRRSGVGAGGLVALGLQGGPIALNANLGVEAHPNNVLLDETNSVILDHRLQAHASWAVVYDTPAPAMLHLEGYFSPTRNAAAPSEIALFGSWPTKSGLSAVAGASTALTLAPTAAKLRVFAGVSFGKHQDRELEGEPVVTDTPAGPNDLIVWVTDAEGRPLLASLHLEGVEPDLSTNAEGRGVLPLGPGLSLLRVEAEGYGAQSREVQLAEDPWAPQTLRVILHPVEGDAAVEFQALDSEDRRVEDARLSLDNEDYGELGSGGRARIEGLAQGDHALGLEAPGFVAGQSHALSASAEAQLARVVLQRPTGTVRVTVRGPDGLVPDVVVRLLGPEMMAPLSLDEQGRQHVQLSPGLWTIAASSATYGNQERDLDLPEDFTGLMEVEMVLRPVASGPQSALSLRVLDPDGEPVQGVDVRLDGAALGSTSSAGTLRVEGLKAGKHTLEMQGQRLRPLPATELTLEPGERELLLTLAWLPGSLRVIARGPEGPVDGVRLRFDGPEPRPDADLGPDGEDYFTLAPGLWTVALSAQALGLQERDVIVAPDETSLLVIDAVLQDREAGDASLTVQITDPDGKPAAGVGVTLDGEPLGRTSSGGTVSVNDLDPGPRTVGLDGGPLWQPLEQKVDLRAGENALKLDLDWKPGAVNVNTRSAEGAVLDALVRLYGVRNIPPTRVGPDGQRTFILDPGDWLVVASSESFGTQEKDVVVQPNQLAEVELQFALKSNRSVALTDEAPPRPVRVVVRSVEGAPIDASLRLLGPERVDGVSTGADGSTDLSLHPAAWELIASADTFGSKRVAFVLEPGAEVYEVAVTLGEEKVEVTKQQVKILEQVNFDLDKATIRPESFPLLDEVANTLILNPQIRRVEIQGHTDSAGTPEYNDELSLRRAEAVRDYLVSKGVSAKRLEAKGYGQRVPLEPGNSEAARAKNRRVQFEILEQSGAAPPVEKEQ